jgi:predicted Fe-Mo cluster-binding NifX family protein
MMNRWWALLFACCLAFISTGAFAAERARIAVASQGRDMGSPVSPVAAKSPYFLIFDETGRLMEGIANPHQNASGGAASRVLDWLSQKGVTVFIAGAFGKNMLNAMKAKGINYMEFNGKVDEALRQSLKK